MLNKLNIIRLKQLNPFIFKC